LAALLLLLAALPAFTQNSSNVIGTLDLTVGGMSATVTPVVPVIPKDVASGVQVVVTLGGQSLSAAAVAQYLGGNFQIEGEYSGPGLSQTLNVPTSAPATNSLVLDLPAVNESGNYTLSNLKFVVNGNDVLDLSPNSVTVNVIDQVLVTSVQTQSLTLAQIQAMGVVLDSDDYTGFQFTIGMQISSQTVNITLPVVFNSQGVSVPIPTAPPTIYPNPVNVSIPVAVVPVLLQIPPQQNGGTPGVLPPNVQIPSLLVIPGNVGYLKQFFSAQLYVGNNSPAEANLSVSNVTGTISLPPGPSGVIGGSDEPLSLPTLTSGPESFTLPVTNNGAGTLAAGQTGEAQWTIVANSEGFYDVNFGINATLNGLPTGPVALMGTASGGLLVRNPYFDMTFTVPSVVRSGEMFNVFTTITNISQAIANNVTVSLDAASLTGMTLVGTAPPPIATLNPGDSATLEYQFTSTTTGAVVANYLNFNTTNGTTGTLSFTLGVYPNGTPMSPDTIQLPSSVDNLPSDLVSAAMRVLGQGWSVATAPPGSLPTTVIPTSTAVVTRKAQALAEAGLRQTLGEPLANVLRDLAGDFWGGSPASSPVDPGFNQVLQTTPAGQNFSAVLGGDQVLSMQQAGGPLPYEQSLANVLVSGPSFLSFAVGNGIGAAPVNVSLTDNAGNQLTTTSPGGAMLGGVIVPLGSNGATTPTLGLVTAPTNSPYTLLLTPTASGTVDLSISIPTGTGSVIRGQITGATVTLGQAMKVVASLTNPNNLVLLVDTNGDGSFATSIPLTTQTISPPGPTLTSVSVIGPETVSQAGPFGLNVAFLYDRPVGATTAANIANYVIPNNSVQSAASELSGRLVFGNLQQPEGPYVPTTMAVSGITDLSGAVGASATVSLQSTLVDPGAVVSGQVLNANGTPSTTAQVIYSNSNEQLPCLNMGTAAPIAALQVNPQGYYQFRYVWQNNCGLPFSIETQDPTTLALQQVNQYARLPGQQIVLNLAMVGTGSVTGQVTDLFGNPISDAAVQAIGGTNPQVGGVTYTDGNGNYTINNITVGPVTVTAVQGQTVGSSVGNIELAGAPAVVNVTLNAGAVSVSGTVMELQNGVSMPVAGLPVVYSANGVVAAYTTTATDGSYSMSNLPAGSFTVSAQISPSFVAQQQGVSVAGSQLTNVNLILVVPSTGTVNGTVSLPNGSPYAGAIVYVNGSSYGTASTANGSYSLPEVPISASQLQTISAITPDGLRTGSTTVSVPSATPVTGANITLSGLGTARFTVLGVTGQPAVGVTVYQVVSGGCSSPQVTDANGSVTFSGVQVGAITAAAVQTTGGYYDLASATVLVTQDGMTATGTMQFHGVGTVSGTVLDPNGNLVSGATVQLTANSPDFSSCQMGTSNGQSVQTGASGTFTFTNVNVGPVSVTATKSLYTALATGSGELGSNGGTASFTLQFINQVSGTLSGNVYLPDGITPAPNVQVTATGPFPATNATTVTTNGTGAYQFAPILAEGNYTITAADPVSGGVAQTGAIYMRPAVNVTQNIILLGTGTVHVTVVDGAGNPVTSAFVTLTETGYPNATLNGSISASNQGVASFANVYDGAFSLQATDSLGRAGIGSGTLPQNMASLNVQVQLTTTGVVQGYFYLPDGFTGIPNAVVQLTQNGAIVAEAITQGTGSVGAFTFNYVPAGPFTLSSQDPQTGRNGTASGSITSQGQTLNVNILAQGLTTVTGLVTQNGAPQPGANVNIQSGTFQGSSTADSTGTYLIAGVPTGTIVATANLGGLFSGTATASETADGSTLNLPVALQSSGSVIGQVLQANGTSPAPPCLVTINIAGSVQTTTSDSQGNFTFPQVPAGPGMITVRELSGIDTGSAPVTVPVGASTTVAVMLNGTGSVTGTAYDSAGNPTAGTVVLNGAGSAYYIYTTTAAADGTFSFAVVPAGAFTAMLTATENGFTLYGMTSGTVQPYGTTAITISTQPSGTVSGQVFHSDGVTPDAGAQVTLTGTGSSGTVTVVADANGNYSFSGVPIGSFTLSVTDPVTSDRGAASGTLTTNGQTLTENITLNGVGSVTVNVNYAAGGTVPNAAVTLMGTGPFGGSYTGSTGPTGSYTFPYVLAGSFMVSATDPVTQFGGVATGSVSANGTTALTIQLQPVLTIEGYIYNPSGVGVSGSTLVLAGYNAGGYFSVQALSASNGSFEFSNLQQAQYTLSSYDNAGLLRARSSTFSLSTIGPTTVNLSWQSIGTVTGFVYTPSDQPAIGAPVIVQSLSTGLSESLQTATDATGAYTVTGVPLGNFTVSVNYPTAQLVGSASGSITEPGQQVTTNVYLVSNAISLPIDLYDGNYYMYNPQPNGSIGNGDDEIFSYMLQAPNTGGFNLNILSGGSPIPFTGNSEAGQELNGQQVDITQDSMAGLTVTRKVYIPPTGYFVRYVEELTNPGSTAVTVGVQVVSNESAQYWPDSIVASSSGNATINVSNTQNPDRWVVIDGTEGATSSGEPPIVAYAFDGPGAAMPVDTASFTTPLYNSAQVIYQWSNVTVQPGGTVAFLHFGAQQSTRASAQASAARLIQLPPEALMGISSQDLAAIQNFAIPANGVSVVSPLPALNGTVSGYVYSGDGVTPIRTQVMLQSNNPYFNLPMTTSTDSTGAFTFTSSLNMNPSYGPVLPVDSFTLSLYNAPAALSGVTVTTNFPAGESSVAQNLVLAGTGTVTGTVSYYNGSPATNGSVSVTEAAYPSYLPSSSISSTGAYTIGGVLPGDGELNAFTNPTFDTSLTGMAPVTVVANQTVTADVTLQGTGTIQGTITDNLGNPLSAQVSIFYSGSYQFTSPSSAYIFTNVPVGTYAISAFQGYTTIASATVVVTAGQTTTYNFMESPMGTLQVNVTYAMGGPAAGAYVLVNGNQYTAGNTDSSGNVTIAGIALGPYTVVAHTPNNYSATGQATGTLTTNGATVPVSVVLPAPVGVASISGQIQYARGVPANGLNIQAYDYSVSPSYYVSTTTDSNGNYTLTGLTAGTMPTIVVYTSSYQQLTTISTATVGAAGTTTTLNIMLAAMATVQVTVLDATGLPVSGQTVYISDAITGGYFSYGAATNSTGVASIASVPQGPFTVQTNDLYTGLVSGSASGTVAVANDGGTISLTINLAQTTNVQGTVFAADGQTPVANATIVATDPQNNNIQLASTQTASNGTYQLYDVAPSTSSFQVTAESPVNASTVSSTVSYSTVGATEIVNLTLPLSILSGQVTYSDGTPVPYPNVFVNQTDSFGNLNTYYPNSTDGSGDYTFYGIPVGAFTVYAQDSTTGLSGSASSSIVQLSTPVQLPVALQPSGSISGNVQIWTGGAVPYVEVTVSSSAINFERDAYADQNGNYSMTGIALGQVVVSAPSPAAPYTTGGAANGAITTSGQNLTLNVVTPQTADMQGTVYASDGATPVPNAYMAVESMLDGGLAEYRNHEALIEGYESYQADSNGNFSFSGVPVGSVEVTAAAPDGSSAGWITGTLGTNATLTLNPVLGNATAFPMGDYVLTDPNGFVYDIACDASLSQGGQNQMGLAASYSGAALLLVDGNSADFCQANDIGALDQNNQQVTIGPKPGGAANSLLEVTRQAYVPPAGGYVRYLDSLTNRLNVPVTTTVEIDTNFASDDVPDTLLVDPTTNGSTYALLQDSTSTAPLLGFVFAGTNASVTPVTNFSIGTMPVSYVWTVTVPPNQTVTLMHFLIQWSSTDTNGAAAQGQALVNMTDPNEFNGMSAQQQTQVVNFNVQ
jgi:protocatechuate 3,4-dioxygenase beta subunit